MNTFITVIAIVSMIVGFIPTALNILFLIAFFLNPNKAKLTGHYGYFAFWLALFVWPIVYFFVR
jgi:hypothetical protein